MLVIKWISFLATGKACTINVVINKLKNNIRLLLCYAAAPRRSYSVNFVCNAGGKFPEKRSFRRNAIGLVYALREIL